MKNKQIIHIISMLTKLKENVTMIIFIYLYKENEYSALKHRHRQDMMGKEESL